MSIGKDELSYPTRNTTTTKISCGLRRYSRQSYQQQRNGQLQTGSCIMGITGTRTRTPPLAVPNLAKLLVLLLFLSTSMVCIPVDALTFPLTSLRPYRCNSNDKLATTRMILHQSTSSTTTSSTTTKSSSNTDKTPYRLSLTPFFDPRTRRERHKQSKEQQQKSWNVSWFPPQKTATLYNPKSSVATATESATTETTKTQRQKTDSEKSTTSTTPSSQLDRKVIPQFSSPNRNQSDNDNNNNNNNSSSFFQAKDMSNATTTIITHESSTSNQNKTNNGINNQNFTEMKAKKKRSTGSVTPVFMLYPFTFPTNYASFSHGNKNKTTNSLTMNTTSMTMNSNSSSSGNNNNKTTTVLASPYLSNSFLDSVTASLQSTTNEFLRSTTANMAATRPTSPSLSSSSPPMMNYIDMNFSATNLPSPLEHLKPNDTLTVDDFLKANRYLLQQQQQLQQQAYPSFVSDMENSISFTDYSSSSSSSRKPRPSIKPAATNMGGTKTVKAKKGGGVVAFPQPSLLRYKDLQKGTTVSGALAGLLVGTTILPNLWLIGMILGATYGYGLHPENDDLAEQTNKETTLQTNPIRRIILTSGRKFAKWYLQLFDYCQTIWFLYKTGQLSYEYYQRYAELDDKFGIQSKMDAWNARFQDGKVKFDQWEKDNEIGRTVLAGLRTMWLVEEQSLKRTSLGNTKRLRTSKYRLVQILYDVLYWCRTRLQRLRVGLRNLLLGEDSSDDGNVSIVSAMKEFFQGVVRGDESSSSYASSLVVGANKSPEQERRKQRRARIAAIVGSIVAVNIANALFAIVSPAFWTVTAVVVGVIWPSWVSEFLSRVGRLTAETRARGRGEEVLPTTPRETLNNAKTWLGLYDRSRYHYWVRPDGTKRYYRTVGRGTIKQQPTVTRLSPPFEWPWEVDTNRSDKAKKRRPQRSKKRGTKQKSGPQWGIFG